MPLSLIKITLLLQLKINCNLGLTQLFNQKDPRVSLDIEDTEMPVGLIEFCFCFQVAAQHDC